MFEFAGRTRTLSRDLATGLVLTMALVLGSVGFFIYVISEREAENTLRFQGEDTVADLQILLAPHLLREDDARVRGIVSAFLQARRALDIRVLSARDALIVGGTRHYNPQAVFEISRDVLAEDRSIGRVIVTFSREDVLRRKREVLATILVVAGFLIISIIFSTRILLARLLRAPLDDLRRGIERISEGEYGRSLPSVKQHDIDRIVQSVNQMARQIERRDQAIKTYAADLERANDELERKLLDLELARIRVQNSENKYKHLVESSSEVIFSLNGAGEFLTVNQAIRKHLGLRPDRLIGTDFCNLLYGFDEKAAMLSRDSFRRHLDNLIETRETVSFRTALVTIQNEPCELEIRLEYIPVRIGQSVEDFVIFGKAASIAEDSLARHCQSERRHYRIGNYLTVADQLANAITVSVARYLDEDSGIGIRIGLREMLINAIEHGNLAISFAEKSRTMEDGTYLGLITQRQHDPRYSARGISVLYSLRARRVLFAIRDDGEGFDHRQIVDMKPVGTDVYHGRGIAIARRFFDVVRYNDRGNRVLLIKYIRNSPD